MAGTPDNPSKEVMRVVNGCANGTIPVEFGVAALEEAVMASSSPNGPRLLREYLTELLTSVENGQVTKRLAYRGIMEAHIAAMIRKASDIFAGAEVPALSPTLH